MAATARCFTKRLLSAFTSVSLVLSSAAHAVADKPYCIRSLQSLNPGFPGMFRGDLVTISLPPYKSDYGEQPARETQAYFVGTIERWSTPRTFVFVEKNTGTVFSIRGAQLEGADTLASQKVPRVSCQMGPTCAVFSTFMGLRYLNHLGLVNDPVTKLRLEQDAVNLMLELLDTPINAEIHELISDGLRRANKGKLPSQTVFRAKKLEELGVDAKVSYSADAVKTHLEKGLPVILDVRVRGAIDRVVRYQKDGKFVMDETWNAQIDNLENPEKVVGYHSVLAIGFIPYGPFQGKLLVLDSGTGDAHLWEYSDLQKTTRMKATLLGPNDKAAETQLRSHIKDWWKENASGKVVVGGISLLGLAGAGVYFLGGDDEKKKKEEEEKKKKEQREKK